MLVEGGSNWILEAALDGKRVLRIDLNGFEGFSRTTKDDSVIYGVTS